MICLKCKNQFNHKPLEGYCSVKCKTPTMKKAKTKRINEWRNRWQYFKYGFFTLEEVKSHMPEKFVNNRSRIVASESHLRANSAPTQQVNPVHDKSTV